MLTPVWMQDRPDDGFDDCFALLRHCTVPEAQDSKVLALQEFRALVVVVRALDMLAAVQFDDQSALEARKIGDGWADWNLAPKARAGNLPAAKLLPRNPLGFGHCLAKFAGKLLRSRF